MAVDDAARLVIEEVIRSRVGRVQEIDVVTRTQPTPMTVFLEAAEESLDHQVDLFWIDDGVPGHFSVRGDDSFAVVFHTRALTLNASARSLLLNPISDVRSEAAERMALRLVAEHLLERGFVDQALQTFARAHRVSGVSFVEPDLDALERASLDDAYLAQWFFPLGHEIGHGLSSSARDALLALPPLALDWIAGMRDAYLEHQYPRESSQLILRRILHKDDSRLVPRSYASARLIQEEVLCDLFALLTLIKAAPAILNEPRGDTVALLGEAQVSADALMFLEQCRRLALFFGDSELELSEQNLAMSAIALGARSNILPQAAVEVGRSPSLAAEYPCVRALLDLDPQYSAFTALNASSRQLSDGLARTRKFLASPEMRNTSLFFDMIANIEGDAVLRFDAARFVQTARLLGVNSGELNLLEQCVA
jgi:hypothetical protein